MDKAYGLLVTNSLQEPLITKHCFGDCGKISMGGAVMADFGGMFLCFESKCPYNVKETENAVGYVKNDLTDNEELPIHLRAFQYVSVPHETTSTNEQE